MSLEGVGFQQKMSLKGVVGKLRVDDQRAAGASFCWAASSLPLLGIISVGLFSLDAATLAEGAHSLFTQGQQALVNHRDQTALDIFRALLARGIRSAPVYSNLGVAYQRLGLQNEAITSFQEAKKLDPSLSGIDLNLGLAFYKHHDFEEGVKQFTAVLVAQPSPKTHRHAICAESLITCWINTTQQ